LDAFSMPLVPVSTKWGLSWHTVRRAELDAIERWDRNEPTPPLRQVGVDEKWSALALGLPTPLPRAA
jgi:hypothetical protein